MKVHKKQDIKAVMRSQVVPEPPSDLEDEVMVHVYKEVKKRSLMLSLRSIAVYSALASTYVFSVVFLNYYYSGTSWLNDLQFLLQIGLLMMVIYYVANVFTAYVFRRSPKNMRSN